jgi:hypothetical protein
VGQIIDNQFLVEYSHTQTHLEADLRRLLLYGFSLLLLCTSATHAQTCGPAIPPAQLKGQLPLEVDLNAKPGTCGFLQFAWQDFVALNWPAQPINPANKTSLARGLPNAAQIIGNTANGDNTAVWEQFQPNWYLFQPNNPPAQSAGGNSYAGWNQYAALPSACGPMTNPPPRILSSLSKFDAMPGVSQAFSAPLIDQTGYYARYEIAMDYTAFNFINSNQFYLLPNVTAFAAKGTGFSFPAQTGNTTGTTFLKAAWKTLSAAEINSGRYHTAQAFLFTPSAPGLEPTCAGPVTVGLVGLHIVHKTDKFGNYLWNTFEQVDNTPADPSKPGPTPPEGWAFYNQSKGPASNPNAQPKCPATVNGSCDFQPTSSHLNDITGGPTQAVRENLLSKSPNQPALGQINSAMRAALKSIKANSVWQYYELVEAQWQKNQPDPQVCAVTKGPNNENIFFPPTKVANMTMETYHQTSSCMGCHASAKVPSIPPAATGTKQVCSDMTFELTLAWQPTELPASRVPPLRPAGRGGAAAKKGGQ